jgi:hypothetical protein
VRGQAGTPKKIIKTTHRQILTSLLFIFAANFELMQKIISTEKIPIKLWLDAPEQGVLKQALNLANLPFAFRHVCLMPDAHEG